MSTGSSVAQPSSPSTEGLLANIDEVLDALAEVDITAVLVVAKRAVDRLGADPLSSLTDDGALTGSVRELQRIETMISAEKLRRVAEIDERQAHVTQGARTTAELLAGQLGLTRGEARTQADTAAALQRLPETAEAYRRGEVGTGQAITATQALGELDRTEPRGEASDEDSAQLDALVAAAAPGDDRAGLRRSVERWANARDADRLADRELRAWRLRKCDTRVDVDGTTVVDVRLAPTGAALVRAAIDALARPDSAADTRSPTQRRADALVTIARQALDAGELPAVALQRPHVVLTVTADALHDKPEATPADLDGHGPVSTATARQICCDAAITTVLTTPGGAVLDVGRTRRDPTRRQRAAVIARDSRCVGCHAPASRCEIHHIHWWSKGGGTDVANLVLLCWSCHTSVHHHGWQVTGAIGGERKLTRPDRHTLLRHTG